MKNLLLGLSALVLISACNQGSGGGGNRSSDGSRPAATAECTEDQINQIYGSLMADGCEGYFTNEEASSAQEKMDCKAAVDREIANPRDKSCLVEAEVEGQEGTQKISALDSLKGLSKAIEQELSTGTNTL